MTLGLHPFAASTRAQRAARRQPPAALVYAGRWQRIALFGESSTRGRLAPGMVADVAVLEGDPMTDVRNFARVRAAMRAGMVIYKR